MDSTQPKIQFFRGAKEFMPGLEIGEPGFTDCGEFYIGTNGTKESNKKICSIDDFNELLLKLSTITDNATKEDLNISTGTTPGGGSTPTIDLNTLIPKVINHDVTVSIAPVSAITRIIGSGFEGKGHLTIKCNNRDCAHINISNCDVKFITIDGAEIYSQGLDCIKLTNNTSCINIKNNSFNGSKRGPIDISGSGVVCSHCTNVNLTNNITGGESANDMFGVLCDFSDMRIINSEIGGGCCSRDGSLIIIGNSSIVISPSNVRKIRGGVIFRDGVLI